MTLMRAILIGIVLALGAHGPAAAERFAMDYEIYAGGLRMLEARIDVDFKPDAYDIEIAASTRGLVDSLVDWETRNRSYGKVAADGTLRPIRHQVDSEVNGKPRTVFMEYDGEGSFIERRVEPSVETEEREPVPDEMTRDTLDALSAVMHAIYLLERGERCDTSVPVYDGRRRFNVVFEQVGMRELDKSRQSRFAGPALKCRVHVELVRGAWKRQNRWLEYSDEDTRRVETDEGLVDVWFGRLQPGSARVPVRLEIHSPFGTGIAHLVAFESLESRRAELAE